MEDEAREKIRRRIGMIDNEERHILERRKNQSGYTVQHTVCVLKSMRTTFFVALFSYSSTSSSLSFICSTHRHHTRTQTQQ